MAFVKALRFGVHLSNGQSFIGYSPFYFLRCLFEFLCVALHFHCQFLLCFCRFLETHTMPANLVTEPQQIPTLRCFILESCATTPVSSPNTSCGRQKRTARIRHLFIMASLDVVIMSCKGSLTSCLPLPWTYRNSATGFFLDEGSHGGVKRPPIAA